MIRPTALALGLVGLTQAPVQAQDIADIAAFETAFFSCVVIANVDTLEMALGPDWRRDPADSEGLVPFFYTKNEQIFVQITPEREFCQVTHLALSTEAATTALLDMMTGGGLEFTEGATDDLGCAALTRNSGSVISVRSGANDATCSNPEASTFRVLHAPLE